MSGIRGRDTRPELLIKAVLRELGLSYRLNRRDLPGSPDFVLPRLRVAVFVHGCFWHQHEGCSNARMPRSRPEFWSAKLTGNKERDERAAGMLNMLGWRVIVVWECATRRLPPQHIAAALLSLINSAADFSELSI